MATNFGSYKCISVRHNENVINYNSGFSWSTNSKNAFLIAIGLTDNQILDTKEAKITQKWC